MTEDLKQVAAFVIEMKALGAIGVRVGEVEVAFGPEYAPAERARPMTARERAKHEEALRFAATEGFPDELEDDEDPEGGL